MGTCLSTTRRRRAPVVTLTRDDVRLLRVALLNYIPPPSDRDRAVGLIAKLEEMEKKK
jgi:hypothetical protein